MKTAISVPDSVFARVEKYTHETGMSRSQLFAQAAEAYLDAAESASITAEINAALDALSEPESEAATLDESSSAAVAAGRRFLAARDDEW